MAFTLNDEIRRLLDGRHFAVMATINPDGGPQTSAMWVGRDGDDVVFSTLAGRRKHRNLLRDPGIGSRIVPIIPDEARTFGLDSLFRDYKIYAPFGQAYEPVDAALLLSLPPGNYTAQVSASAGATGNALVEIYEVP